MDNPENTPNDITQNETILTKFNRLVEDLLAGKMQRSKFDTWEIDLLLDAMTCDLSQFAKAESILRRYQLEVQDQIANGATLPMKLSDFLRSRGVPSKPRTPGATRKSAGA